VREKWPRSIDRYYSDYQAPGSGNSARWYIFDCLTGGRPGDQIATVYEPDVVRIIVDALNARRKKNEAA
jgi:hypothetical protein